MSSFRTLVESPSQYKQDLLKIIDKYTVKLSNEGQKNINALIDGAATFTEDKTDVNKIKKWVDETRENAELHYEYFDLGYNDFLDLLNWTSRNADTVVQYLNAPNLKELKELVDDL